MPVGTGPRRISTVDLRGIFNSPDLVLTFFRSPPSRSVPKAYRGLPPKMPDSMRLFSAGFAVPKSGVIGEHRFHIETAARAGGFRESFRDGSNRPQFREVFRDFATEAIKASGGLHKRKIHVHQV